MRRRHCLLVVIWLLGCGAAPDFSQSPWLEDLRQMRTALIAKYANLQWAVTDRGADLPALYAETEKRIATARSDAEAQAAFERFARRLGDEHVDFRWASAPSEPSRPAQVSCESLGFEAAKSGTSFVVKAPGYRALETPQSAEFPAGFIAEAGHKVGVIRIGLFSPEGFPSLCEAALKALSIPTDRACDENCEDRISRWTHARLTEDFARQLRALRAGGGEILLVDVTGNGGGSEWAEAAARMLTTKRLVAERVAFVAGDHWASRFARDEKDLRIAAEKAHGTERRWLQSLAAEVHDKLLLARKACSGEPLWRGQTPDCPWLRDGFYATGILASADPAQLRGKPYAESLFSPMQYPFEEGIWQGPLLVLVDRDSYSATEEFAATLQDNRAAIILGEPTGGAGCGHTNGGTPVTLKNSGAVLEMPDCVRLRADGSNEIQGVQPDVLIGFTPRDGAALKARRFMATLPQAVARAIAP